jgi:hypothetical protein
VPREKELATDAFFSDDGDEDETLGSQVTISAESTETPEEVKRVLASRVKHAARDQAFESDGEPETIESPTAESEQSPLRVARNPAA